MTTEGNLDPNDGAPPDAPPPSNPHGPLSGPGQPHDPGPAPIPAEDEP